ncbi:hypothetical protein [Nisaea sp.]|uniref:hypothetical protein n=1 Tax=Nisaea sp. TaxID=2024842 RepID=UPI003B526E9E
MPTSKSDLENILERFGVDPDFFAACRAEISGKLGDEAILAMMNFAARNGYEITFREASEAHRAARLDAAKALRTAIRHVSGDAGRLEDFLKQW